MNLTNRNRRVNSCETLCICVAASAGGHLTQLLSLSVTWQRYEVFYVSTGDVAVDKFKDPGSVYLVGECNRRQPFKCLAILLRCFLIALKQKPDVVISTGAAPGCIFSLVSKLLGAKIVWIDSIANVERLSLSGRVVRPFTSLFLTQWPDLADRYNNVEYVGSIV